jgi:hypothetical protein
MSDTMSEVAQIGVAVFLPLSNWRSHWRMAKIGEGESKIVGIEMKDRLRLKPKRKVVWNKLKTCVAARETMLANGFQRGLVKGCS